jgi:hypothetical protein
MRAQVTIGANLDPNEGSLLDLKEYPSNQSVTSSKGLGMPRVNLSDFNKLYPMLPDNYDDDENAKHAGLMVYNIQGACRYRIPEGLYVWTGAKWEGLYPADDATKSVDITVNVPDGNGDPIEIKTMTFLTYNLGANPNMTPKEQMAYVSPMTNPAEYITLFGGLYQWGRKDTEHSLRCSRAAVPGSFMNAQYTSAADATAGGKFVYGYTDWINPAVADLWGNGGGLNAQTNTTYTVNQNINNPCPPNYRVPTQYEWALLGNEGGDPGDTANDNIMSITASGSSGNSSGIVWVPVSEGKASTSWSGGKTNGYALYTQAEWDKYTPGADLTTDAAPEPLLFLPAGGYRDYSGGSGNVLGTGSTGRYWSSVVKSGNISYIVPFDDSGVRADNGDGHYRTFGLSVRCIKE